MNTLPPTHRDPYQGKITGLYVAFGISVLLTLIPHLWAAAASLLMLIYALGTAYVYRSQAGADSLAGNHATFIIRTIWISGFMMIFTLIASCIYMLQHIDNTTLMPCIEKFIDLAPQSVALQDIMTMQALFHECMDEFVAANFRTFIISLTIAGGPILLYIMIRFIRGFSRAVHGYRLAKPKAWF